MSLCELSFADGWGRSEREPLVCPPAHGLSREMRERDDPFLPPRPGPAGID